MRIGVIVAWAVGIAIGVGAVVGAAEDGGAVYTAQCAKCHGETGKADTPAGKAMKAPAIAGDKKIAGMSEADIAALIKNNEKHKSFAAKLTAEQLNAVAAKTKSLASGS